MCVCIPFQVDQCLSSLQTEVENVILRMAAEFPLRKEQLLFLINNYDMMLSVLTVGRPHPFTIIPHTHTHTHTHTQERTSDDCKESESFKSLLHARTQEFVEEVSHKHIKLASLFNLSLSPPSFSPLTLSLSSITSGVITIFWWNHIICEGL